MNDNLQHPFPFAYAYAAKEVQTIAAPLLTAAALSLAGVVAGASSKTFLWPGPTLLLLVAASLLLVASIQLHYHSRQYLYTCADIEEWVPEDISPAVRAKLYEWQGDDFSTWMVFHNRAVHCFNTGTVFLGIGVAAALWPPEEGTQATWRTVAAIMVLLGVAVEVGWMAHLYSRSGSLEEKRRRELSKIS
ncbi:hypothetical protein [Nonomuraea rubra]|uniref:Peptidoglycan/LPS O-acetylase OafA/YrhL n=1 Tax=Nonomuraea rubra TaxID=46180 RepID=A0A7X0TX54_9ACTN|nr:hypothetical protein [Nonomuraea rubra]MBB6547048.1 peptidoglycan/LPS O-acetylase OafA/YrhL [Nonomuraea rubra]